MARPQLARKRDNGDLYSAMATDQISPCNDVDSTSYL